MIATYDFSNLLIELKQDLNGFRRATIREGGLRQVEWTTTVETVSAKPPDEPVFQILAKNQVNIGGQTISVLNDELTVGDFHLAPSNPTLSEYLALIGQPVKIAFSSRKQQTAPGEPEQWKVARTTIILL